VSVGVFVLVALAGGVGAWCRFRLDGLMRARVRGTIPLGTLIINITGSFALGLLVGWAGRHAGASDVRFVLGTGLLGGYTTFSTAAVELATLTREGRLSGAAVLGVAMVVLGLVAAASGLVLGRVL
jgi:fluoride exporter